MTITDMQKRALEVAEKYNTANQAAGREIWDASAYMAGFVGDVGDLSKLIMASANYRQLDDTDTKIAHELSDCLWSVLILAHEFNIELEQSFDRTMKEIEGKLTS